MRPEDLKSGFRFADRRPLIKDHILYVPDYYFEHEAFSMPTLSSIFSNENPIHIEYCTGHGDWIIEKALSNPLVNWIAVEKQFERVRKIFSKRANHNVKNLFIICGEAYTATKYYLPSGCIEKAYMNFPDPWPKQRHAKHRLIKETFVQELSRVIVKGGEMAFATDDPSTSESIIAEMLQSNLWQSMYCDPYFITDLPGYGTSFFEKLWRGLGKQIHYMQFKHFVLG
ncbi:MAG: tRNA (guanine(46)-N(7))-methyltransferase TrmB [Chlamydiota bacterium]